MIAIRFAEVCHSFLIIMELFEDPIRITHGSLEKSNPTSVVGSRPTSTSFKLKGV